MPKPKLYESEAWLRRQYYVNKKSIDEIAAMCKINSMTIRRKFTLFGIK